MAVPHADMGVWFSSQIYHISIIIPCKFGALYKAEVVSFHIRVGRQKVLIGTKIYTTYIVFKITVSDSYNSTKSTPIIIAICVMFTCMYCKTSVFYDSTI